MQATQQGLDAEGISETDKLVLLNLIGLAEQRRTTVQEDLATDQQLLALKQRMGLLPGGQGENRQLNRGPSEDIHDAEVIEAYATHQMDVVVRRTRFRLVKAEERSHILEGLIVALDLEQYDYREGSRSLIRATEGTILDRLPPRIRVRERASIELPHIMVLIDDPEQTVIEPLFSRPRKTAYDFPLMLGGGHIRGYRVDDDESIRQVAAALERLADPAQFARRYEVEGRPVVLYAMGDGNHSFATAKAIWEKLKAEASDRQAIMDHPARYALVELVNLHDPGLEFEAIHRVLFDVDVEAFLLRMANHFAAEGALLRCERKRS